MPSEASRFVDETELTLLADKFQILKFLAFMYAVENGISSSGLDRMRKKYGMRSM